MLKSRCKESSLARPGPEVLARDACLSSPEPTLLQIFSTLSELGLFGFRRLGTCLLQSYAGPATVLVDELDAQLFEGFL
jgi:hypothetical protein